MIKKELRTEENKQALIKAFHDAFLKDGSLKKWKLKLVHILFPMVAISLLLSGAFFVFILCWCGEGYQFQPACQLFVNGIIQVGKLCIHFVQDPSFLSENFDPYNLSNEQENTMSSLLALFFFVVPSILGLGFKIIENFTEKLFIEISQSINQNFLSQLTPDQQTIAKQIVGTSITNHNLYYSYYIFSKYITKNYKVWKKIEQKEEKIANRKIQEIIQEKIKLNKNIKKNKSFHKVNLL